jgi:hypothetical protein
MTPITLESVEEHTLLRPDLIAQLKERFASGDSWLQHPALADRPYRASIWMHGTLRRFRAFGRPRNHEHPDWDGHLGTHFTNSTWAAQMFAIGEIGHRPRRGGRIAVCLLRASSPITFELRSQLTVSALIFGLDNRLVRPYQVRAAGNEMHELLCGPFAMYDYGFHPRDFTTAVDALLAGAEPPGESLEAGFVISMAALRQVPNLAPQYVSDLRSRGYDSIICEPNEPMETVAIVFESKQIELVEWQPAWDAVLARVLLVRGQRGDEDILKTAISATVANARHAGGRRQMPQREPHR